MTLQMRRSSRITPSPGRATRYVAIAWRAPLRSWKRVLGSVCGIVCKVALCSDRRSVHTWAMPRGRTHEPGAIAALLRSTCERCRGRACKAERRPFSTRCVQCRWFVPRRVRWLLRQARQRLRWHERHVVVQRTCLHGLTGAALQEPDRLLPLQSLNHEHWHQRRICADRL